MVHNWQINILSYLILSYVILVVAKKTTSLFHCTKLDVAQEFLRVFGELFYVINSILDEISNEIIEKMQE